jgi:hypothetical protein
MRQAGIPAPAWDEYPPQKKPAMNIAGGVWNREKGLWELRYQDAVALGLEKGIVFRDIQI